jgi:hypothetical protein
MAALNSQIALTSQPTTPNLLLQDATISSSSELLWDGSEDFPFFFFLSFFLRK